MQALIDLIAAGQLPIEIALVVSNNADAYGLQRAESAKIKTKLIDHKSYSSRLAFDEALVDEIDLVEPDIIILAGFMRILTTAFVHHYSNRLVNIHPSLLPKYPGTNTHQRAIDAQDDWHGASIHFVVPEVDAGPIILQGRIRVRPNDTAESLQSRIHHVEHQLYPQAVKWLAQGRLSIKNGLVLLDDETSDEQLQTFEL